MSVCACVRRRASPTSRAGSEQASKVRALLMKRRCSALQSTVRSRCKVQGGWVIGPALHREREDVCGFEGKRDGCGERQELKFGQWLGRGQGLASHPASALASSALPFNFECWIRSSERERVALGFGPRGQAALPLPMSRRCYHTATSGPTSASAISFHIATSSHLPSMTALNASSNSPRAGSSRPSVSSSFTRSARRWLRRHG